MDTNTCDALARLLEIVEHAIAAGDWKVDGACDPDADIEYAKHVLRSHGWVQNGVDASWMRPLGKQRKRMA